MPALLHSPARIVRQLLIDLGLGVAGTYANGIYSGGPWPVFAPSEPATPDNCITVKKTTNVDFGWSQIDGSLLEYHGFQVRIRATDDEVGAPKASAIFAALNEGGYPVAVVVGGTTYCVGDAPTRGVIDLGKDVPSNKLNLYTLNGLVYLVAS